MKLFRKPGAVLLAIFIIFSGPVLAAGEAAQDNAFVSMAQATMGVLAAVVGITIGIVIKRLGDLAGIQIDAKHREALQSALENAARLALGLLESKMTGRPLERSDPALIAATEYVKRSVPDAVEHFNLSDRRIADLINPKLIPKV